MNLRIVETLTVGAIAIVGFLCLTAYATKLQDVKLHELDTKIQELKNKQATTELASWQSRLSLP